MREEELTPRRTKGQPRRGGQKRRKTLGSAREGALPIGATGARARLVDIATGTTRTSRGDLDAGTTLHATAGAATVAVVGAGLVLHTATGSCIARGIGHRGRGDRIDACTVAASRRSIDTVSTSVEARVCAATLGVCGATSWRTRPCSGANAVVENSVHRAASTIRAGRRGLDTVIA